MTTYLCYNYAGAGTFRGLLWSRASALLPFGNCLLSHFLWDALTDPHGVMALLVARLTWLGALAEFSRIAIHTVHFSLAELVTPCLPDSRSGT
jgi:hypothetical protein